MSAEFFSYLMDATPSSEVLFHLMHVYGVHLVLLCLSAITVYRREMSCNHCYAEQEEGNRGAKVGAPIEVCYSGPGWDEHRTEELLESAGLFCSGAALLPAMLQLLEHCRWNKTVMDLDRTTAHAPPQAPLQVPITTFEAATPSTNQNQANCARPPFNGFGLLNVDTQICILSYLPPQDVASFECVSKLCRSVVHEQALWKTLWNRDYAWVLHAWDIGKRAAHRSGQTTPDRFDKEFYARFQLCWQNFVLAGENTYDSCLVALSGHVFDITFFLASHPGSPETVMVHAGKDATDFFMGVRHSLGARRLAQSLCVVVDSTRSTNDCCGLYPTPHTSLTTNVARAPALVESVIDCLSHPQPARLLQSVRARFLQEEAVAQQIASRYGHLALSGETNVYFDPLANRWKAWYTDRQLQAIFIDRL